MQVNLSIGVIAIVFGFTLGLWFVFYVSLFILNRTNPAFAKKVRRQKNNLLLIFLCVFLILLLLAPIVLKPVLPGEVGILWKRFTSGTHEQEFHEGTVLVAPWDKLYIYSARYTVLEQTFDAVTTEGLNIRLNVAIRYRPILDQIGELHRFVGPDYPHRLLVPEIGSETRLIVSKHTAEEVYAEKREDIQNRIYRETVADLGVKELIGGARQSSCPPEDSGSCKSPISEFVHLEDVLIRSIELPELVQEAIVHKVNQLYLEQEYEIRKRVAKLEAERKAIEATGVRDFQETVVGGISETYLKWRGIEATLELAKSNNTKVVVVGGSDGLPLILNTEGNLNSGVSAQSNEPTKASDVTDRWTDNTDEGSPAIND